jgi:CheY-like chemotaxis protein
LEHGLEIFTVRYDLSQGWSRTLPTELDGPATLVTVFGAPRFGRDTGIGLAPEHREIIFEPFRQVDGSSARRSGGSGLCLSICRRLVDRLGGQIGLDSALGLGSTFWFSVPVKALPQPALGSRDVESTPVNDLSGTRVLVAEDNEVNREMIVEILTLAGVDVSVARNGREATDLCAAKDFDVVLMDCLMPELDGFAAARIIRGRAGPKPPIVAFTANSGSDIRGRCLEAGMDDVLSKPASPSEVLATIRRWAR